MENQNTQRESYSHTNEERRQDSLPSITSRLPPSSALMNELPLSRQSGITSSHYTQSEAIPHSSYDPVHDAYNLPRISTGHIGQPPAHYNTEGYARGDRNAPYSYSASPRYDLPVRPSSTMPPMEDYRRERQPYTPSHELESLSYRSSAHHTGHGMHSFRVQQMAHGVDQRSGAYITAISDTSGAYPPLSPMSLSGSSGAEDKGSPKRIVMACHQCRARKIRCDAERPTCKNCIRRREECTYDDKPKRRGPDKIPGSRMRSCKSKRQAIGDASEASGSSSALYPVQAPSPDA